MNILLLGAQGQLGGEIGQVWDKISNNHPHDKLIRWGRNELVLTRDKKIIGTTIRDAKPDVVINAAAMTDVDACEVKRELAIEINTDIPGVLAEVCKDIGSLLVHISTDYVFGGDEDRIKPYVETDNRAPINQYGWTKLKGENKVVDAGCDYLIIRTCGSYGGKSKRPTYIEQVSNKVEKKDRIRATIDQIYSPTNVTELATAILKLIRERKRGILHVVNTQPVSRFDFTKEIVKLLHSDLPVEEAYQKEFSTLAKRPKYCPLDSKFINLDQYMSDWKTALQNYIKKRVS
jgi:dTDP-4-dehydrorhamnose reductase